MSLPIHSITFKLGALVLAAAIAGCASTGDSDSASKGSGILGTLSSLGGAGSSSTANQVGAAADVFKAVTVSDADVKSASLQMRATEDKKLHVATGKNKYAQRLARLTHNYIHEDGMTLNFKVYITKEINANATPDGSIRVYSGLMNIMNDQELLGVIGHEIGHVKLGHAMSAMRTAYMASAGRKAAASTSGVGGVLAASQLGALGEAFVDSQFSQSQETAADDYGLAFLKKHGYDGKAMESALRKLAALDNGKKSSALAGMLSSHPDPGKRADRIHEELAAK
jgi:putative metalloprotease